MDQSCLEKWKIRFGSGPFMDSSWTIYQTRFWGLDHLCEPFTRQDWNSILTYSNVFYIRTRNPSQVIPTVSLILGFWAKIGRNFLHDGPLMKRIFVMRSRIEPRFFFNEKYTVVLSFSSFIDASDTFETLFQPVKNRARLWGDLACRQKKTVAIYLYHCRI